MCRFCNPGRRSVLDLGASRSAAWREELFASRVPGLRAYPRGSVWTKTFLDVARRTPPSPRFLELPAVARPCRAALPARTTRTRKAGSGSSLALRPVDHRGHGEPSEAVLHRHRAGRSMPDG